MHRVPICHHRASRAPGRHRFVEIALVLAVILAASTSFLAPIGYQANSMIFGTGLYRFTDFAKVWALPNLLLMVVTSLGIRSLWLVLSGTVAAVCAPIG